ncbi:RNA-binding protein MEX3B-like [Brienomyrus brachyistius]|uniref:RNA-binding protein MEX3B-like n=1 Tax=Brienomyrus brachyistius TaxID=42636 RepID=UPI0020B2242A|nr:RNA-binding protein MEX3B-like [Brienomyrus brachyistius]
MPSPLFHSEIMDSERVISNQHSGVVLPDDSEPESRDEEHQDALRFALDQLSLMAVETDCSDGGGMVDSLDATDSNPETCNGVGGGFGSLQILEHSGGSPRSSVSCSPPEEYYGTGGFHMNGPLTHSMLGETSSALCSRKRSVNMTECVPVPSSEHVAEIVGRQGCKIKALRTKTNTYIKTPVRGEQPVFIVTGRREDVEMAKREILSAAEHFSMIRASRCKAGGGSSAGAVPGPPHLPGQTTIQVRVPYRVVGLVVGPKGATIKRIQQQTHTYIVTPSRDKDPVFEVTGMPENVDRAREEIETHITLRTGAFVDLQGDNDFHSNGTDVSLEGLGAMGLGGALWSRASHPSSPSAPLSLHHPTRKVTPASFSGGGGSLGSESYAGTRRAPESGSSPGSPFSAVGGGGFTFGGESTPGLPAAPAEELAFEFGAAHIWRPLLNGSQRRNSSGLSGGTVTPRLSPTLSADQAGLDHPLARRAQSDPLSTLSWLQAGNASFSASSSSSSGGSSTGYSSSCSASSLPGGSPTELEGGVGTSGMLGHFKAGALAVGPAEASKDCLVCYESEVTAALVPCGHKLFCMDCAGQICQSGEPKCPVCHMPATQCIRIFS